MNKCKHDELERYERDFYRCKKCKEVRLRLSEQQVWEEIRTIQQWLNVYSHCIDAFRDDMEKVKGSLESIYDLLKTLIR